MESPQPLPACRGQAKSAKSTAPEEKRKQKPQMQKRPVGHPRAE